MAKTHDEVSDRMCLPITSQELLFKTVAGKKRARDKARQLTPAFRDYRTLAKMTKSHRMGKEDAKKHHETDKVPLSESAKKSVMIKSNERPRGNHQNVQSVTPRNAQGTHSTNLQNAPKAEEKSSISS